MNVWHTENVFQQIKAEINIFLGGSFSTISYGHKVDILLKYVQFERLQFVASPIDYIHVDLWGMCLCSVLVQPQWWQIHSQTCGTWDSQARTLSPTPSDSGGAGIKQGTFRSIDGRCSSWATRWFKTCSRLFSTQQTANISMLNGKAAHYYIQVV